MSSAAGRRSVPNRCSRASTVARTSSSESVVWLITATGLPADSSRAASSGDSTTTVDSGRSPRVPITSTWFACPTSATRWPLSAYRRASACTFDTRGQTAPLAVLAHRGRDAVRRQNADLAGRNLVLVVDEHGAHPLEPAHDMVVVDDVMADVDRRPVLGEQPFDDLDRAVDARTEGSRCRKEHALGH